MRLVLLMRCVTGVSSGHERKLYAPRLRSSSGSREKLSKAGASLRLARIEFHISWYPD